MKTDKITFILIPPDDQKQKIVKLNYLLFKALSVLATLLLVAIIILAAVLVNRSHKLETYQKDIAAFEDNRQEIVSLVENVNEMCEFNNYLRQLIGLDLNSIDVDLDKVLSLQSEGKGINTDYIPDYAPADGPVTQGFMSAGRKHYGIDIAGKIGDPVVASAEGFVVFSGWTADLGNMVVISHDRDYITVYGHNDQLLVKQRQKVKKGDMIALLGNTGYSSGPHLHFEVWYHGDPINPREIIAEYHDK